VKFLNEFFTNVAKNIGDADQVDENHPSIQAIKTNIPELAQPHPFYFADVTEDFFFKSIKKINIRKVTGIAGTSPKLLHIALPIISKSLSQLINISISTSTFPDQLKLAQVTPLHKNNSSLENGNYRPVSVPPAISKIFERAIGNQLTMFFKNVFNPFWQLFGQDSDVSQLYYE
jgi:hypothetical protein